MMKTFIHIFSCIIFISCTTAQNKTPTHNNFDNYWYENNAEITSFELTQARYGEYHTGEAVMIFVTEPFSESKQVKLDDWKNNDDQVGVLKFNMTKKFLTGIYPYSMMMSTFVPITEEGLSPPMKVTTTVQEWCGQTFMQLNEQNSSYRIRGFSYFESEGDIDVTIPKILLEDQLWTMIRINPDNLPQGKHDILPATFYLRLKHKNTTPVMAHLTSKVESSSTFYPSLHRSYKIEYPKRTLKIYFENSFPYPILGWEEILINKDKTVTTSAKKKKMIKTTYWSQNKNHNRMLRKQLNLKIYE